MLVNILRKYQGEMSQREYAIRIGIDPSTLSLIYKGERNPGMEVVRGLARAFPQASAEIAAALAAPAEVEDTPAPLAVAV